MRQQLVIPEYWLELPISYIPLSGSYILGKIFLILIDGIIGFINSLLYGIGRVIDYSIKFWSTIVIKRFTLGIMKLVLAIFRRMVLYLESVEDNITFRLLYKKTTSSLKERYKELRKKKL